MAGRSPAAGGDTPPEPEGTPAPEAPPRARRSPAGSRSPRNLPSAPAAVDDGAGFILGLLAWGWLVLPFLKSGPAGVKATLMAKFFNKGSDGSWLP